MRFSMEKVIRVSWIILCMHIVTMVITSCGTVNNTQQPESINYDKEEIEKSITGIVLSDSDSSDTELFSAEFNFSSYDKEAVTYEDDYKVYFGENAVYLQVNMSMYRFQIDKDGKISDYIKYKLEA